MIKPTKRQIVLSFLFTLFFLFLVGTGHSALEKKTDKSSEVAVTYADDFIVDPENFWPDSQFEKKFVKYWELRFDGEAEQAFLMEAPYFQEMVNFNKYRTFVKKNPNLLVELKMRMHDQRSQRLHLIHYTARLKDSNGVIRDFNLIDHWIFFDNQWYHVWRDSLVFKGVS